MTGSREKEHVLVTDDSLTVRMMLRDYLEQEGYRVTLQPDGESCIQFLNACEDWPDLVLLDRVLPGVDGIEVLNWIKTNSGSSFHPVILLTSMGEVDDRVTGLDHGADDYIAKPFEAEELMARVRAQCRIKRLQDELGKRNLALATADREKAELLRELERKNEELERLATTDPLTGLANRAHIEDFLSSESTRSTRFGLPLSVAMIDVDFFKSINDTHGHPVGDQVLREVGRILSESVRKLDKVGRYGGEEFLLVLPGTPVKGARILGERIRASAAGFRLTPPGAQFTLSVGIAQWTADLGSWEALVARADQALYAAKEGGRDQVRVWEDLSSGVPQ